MDPKKDSTPSERTIERNRHVQLEEFDEELSQSLKRMKTVLNLTQSMISAKVGLSQPMISQLASAHRGLPSTHSALDRLREINYYAKKAEKDPSLRDALREKVLALEDIRPQSSRSSRPKPPPPHEVPPPSREPADELLFEPGTEGAGRPVGNRAARPIAQAAVTASDVALTMYRCLTYLASPKELEALADLAETAAPGLAPALRAAGQKSAREFAKVFGGRGELPPS